MKSQVVLNVDKKNLDKYTELQVCKSAAGYYVGTMYNNPEGFQEPGSRDSGYFRSWSEAENELHRLETGGKPTRVMP